MRDPQPHVNAGFILQKCVSRTRMLRNAAFRLWKPEKRRHCRFAFPSKIPEIVSKTDDFVLCMYIDGCSSVLQLVLVDGSTATRPRFCLDSTISCLNTANTFAKGQTWANHLPHCKEEKIAEICRVGPCPAQITSLRFHHLRDFAVKSNITGE